MLQASAGNLGSARLAARLRSSLMQAVKSASGCRAGYPFPRSKEIAQCYGRSSDVYNVLVIIKTGRTETTKQDERRGHGTYSRLIPLAV